MIRPCGPQAGVNRLADCRPVGPALAVVLLPDRTVRLSWPATEGFNLQAAASLGPAQWQTVADPPTVEGDQNVVIVTPTSTTFYRLAR